MNYIIINNIKVFIIMASYYLCINFLFYIISKGNLNYNIFENSSMPKILKKIIFNHFIQ